MSKNDPTGKAHYDVTKTSSQKAAKSNLKHEMSEAAPSGDFAPKTPSGMLSGLRGVLADRASNKSDSRSVGASGPGSTAKTQSSRPGIDYGKPYPYPTGPDTTVSSDSDNENFGSQSSNNIKHGKGPKQPKTHKME